MRRNGTASALTLIAVTAAMTGSARGEEPAWRAKAEAQAPGTVVGAVDLGGRTVALRHAYAARHDAGAGTVYWKVVLVPDPLPADKVDPARSFSDFGAAPDTGVVLNGIDLDGEMILTVNVQGRGVPSVGGLEPDPGSGLSATPKKGVIGRVVVARLKLDVTFNAGQPAKIPKM